jgi:hypothetical protein
MWKTKTSVTEFTGCGAFLSESELRDKYKDGADVLRAGDLRAENSRFGIPGRCLSDLCACW